MTVSEEKLYAEQQALTEKQQFFISGRIWHELSPKVIPVIFRDVLRREIDLSKYGDGIAKYYFTFVAMKVTPNFKSWVGAGYNRKLRHADIGIELPYEALFHTSQKETIQLMEKAFLEGIDLIPTLKLAGPFDQVAFKKDVEAIFAKEDWFMADLKKYADMLEEGNTDYRIGP